MRAGKLRHRVTIQENNPTRDSDGAELDNWENVDTVWAAVIPLSGKEQFIFNGDQLLAQATTRIEIRYRTGLDSKMRVTWGDHVYDIQTILEVESARQELHLLCKELNP